MGTTAEKLTYLNTTKTLIKDNLNLGGANISNEPFRVYSSKLIDIYKDFLANGTDTLWNNWNKVSGTGESLTLNNTIKGKMKIDLKGNTSQEGEPTPDYPQDIHVVSGDNTIKVEGKNLFDISYMTQKNYNASGTELQNFYTNNNGILTISRTNAGSGRTFFNKLLLQAGTYSIGFDISASGTDKYFWRSIRDMDNLTDIVSSNKISINDYPHYTFTFTLSSATNIGISINPNDNNTGTLSISNIQLEKGSASTYEPYQSTTYPINLGSIELCKIGDYQDKFFKAINGNTIYDNLDSSIKDTLDYGEWYLEKKIKKATMGNVLSVGTASSGIKYAQVINLLDALQNGVVLCSKYLNNNDATKNNTIRLAVISLYVYDNTFETTTIANNALNGLEYYYPLATPTYIPITGTLASQLEAIKYSYNNQTNITQTNDDKPFILDVTALGELEI